MNKDHFQRALWSYGVAWRINPPAWQLALLDLLRCCLEVECCPLEALADALSRWSAAFDRLWKLEQERPPRSGSGSR